MKPGMRVKTEKERIFRAVDEVIGDGMLEVPVPDMSRETIYDDEPKTLTKSARRYGRQLGRKSNN